ncbi:MAG TPA: LemA family protein [Acidimicrobiia bacterium]|jgi:LemA protein
MVGLIIIIVVVVILVLIAIATYNGLVRIRTRVDNAWAQIDVQLKRRHDLIPNLIETVKGYAAHERETLDSVVQARNQAVSANSPEQQGQAENLLTQSLGKLFALAEAYPNLKANQNFLELQEELTATEDKVAYARQFYNDSVQSYNARIATIPAKFFAGPMGYKAREYFQTDAPEDRDVPKVQF